MIVLLFTFEYSSQSLTGEVKVTMMNHGKMSYQVQEGDRIAQMIIEKIDMSGTMEVDNLQLTDRGNKGFGSTDLWPKRTIAVEQFKSIISIIKSAYFLTIPYEACGG